MRNDTFWSRQLLTLICFFFFYQGIINSQSPWIPDPLFGTDGMTRFDFGPLFNDSPNDILLLPDDKILTAGISINSFDYFISMSQLLPDGQPDISDFGSDGEVLLHFVLRDHVNDLELQPDGKILAAGTEAVGNGGSQITPALYRFNADGSLDTSFADSGKAVQRFNGNLAGEMYGVKVLSDGRIVTAGYNTGSGAFGVMRFLSDGERDASFGNNGEAVLQSAAGFHPVGCLFLGDTAVVMVTVAFTNSLTQFIMAMMDSSGSPYPGFGSNGIVNTGINGLYNFSGGESLALTEDDKIILSGTTPDSGPTKFSVFRFFLNGIIDSSFGTNGRTDIEFSTGSSVCYDMAIDHEGKILLVGSASGGFGMAGLARLNPDGSPDTSFAPEGRFILNMNNNTGTHYLTKCLPLDNGDILAAGYDFASNSGDFVITRLTQSTTGIFNESRDNRLEDFVLYQNYPNPFNPSTNIRFNISEQEYVSLKVYDILGNELATLFNEEKEKGTYSVSFDASHLASGIYFYKLQAGSFVQTKKMLLIK